MKVQAIQRFRAKLRAGQPTYGLWVTLESPSITESAVALGLDWVVIDAEHGHLDWKEVIEHLRATVRSDTVALVRIADRDTALAKRALDIGADGIVIPWMETAEQVREAVRDCRYPPAGRRGIGGERATVWGQCMREHTAEANENVIVVPLIEGVAAIKEVPAMCEVDGVDMFYFGPADFSSSAGYAGQWEGPGVAEQILKLKDTIRDAGKHCGLLSTSVANLIERREQGFQLLGLGSDVGLLFRSLHESLQAVARDRAPATSLDPADGTVIKTPAKRPAETMRPDRGEVIVTRGKGQPVTLQAGVTFLQLAGEISGQKGLTTGVVAIEPEAYLDLHTHPCSESITVLDGQLEVTVEGRVHRLGQLDNIAIPRWLPHAARNPDSRSPARLHVALAMTNPARDLVTRTFEREVMPVDSTGKPGFERVTRFKTATKSFSVGSNSTFIDYFNSDLVPGIEMSGGYGVFEPKGRLPAHVHDFDESICIIDGSATCIVEGREYELEDCATATVPRGRVHYFVNRTNKPMAMIWVYAGPRPERIVVDEACATTDGNPWK